MQPDVPVPGSVYSAKLDLLRVAVIVEPRERPEVIGERLGSLAGRGLGVPHDVPRTV